MEIHALAAKVLHASRVCRVLINPMLKLLPRALLKFFHGRLHEAETQHRGELSTKELNFEIIREMRRGLSLISWFPRNMHLQKAPRSMRLQQAPPARTAQPIKINFQ